MTSTQRFVFSIAIFIPGAWLWTTHLGWPSFFGLLLLLWSNNVSVGGSK